MVTPLVTLVVGPWESIVPGSVPAAAVGLPNGAEAVRPVPLAFSCSVPRLNGLPAEYGVLMTSVPVGTVTTTVCGSGLYAGAVVTTVTPVVSDDGAYAVESVGMKLAVMVAEPVAVGL